MRDDTAATSLPGATTERYASSVQLWRPCGMTQLHDNKKSHALRAGKLLRSNCLEGPEGNEHQFLKKLQFLYLYFSLCVRAETGKTQDSDMIMKFKLGQK